MFSRGLINFGLNGDNHNRLPPGYIVRVDDIVAGTDKAGADNTLVWDSGTPGDDAATCHILYTAAVAAIVPTMFSGSTPLVQTWEFVRALHDGVKVFINEKILIYSENLTFNESLRADRYVGHGSLFARQEDGTLWMQEDGIQVYQEGGVI